MLHDLRCVQQNGCLQLLKRLPYKTTFGGCNRASTLLNMSHESSFAPLHSQLLADLEFRHCQMHYLLNVLEKVLSLISIFLKTNLKNVNLNLRAGVI